MTIEIVLKCSLSDSQHYVPSHHQEVKKSSRVRVIVSFSVMMEAIDSLDSTHSSLTPSGCTVTLLLDLRFQRHEHSLFFSHEETIYRRPHCTASCRSQAFFVQCR
jgi:hypothetical protein